MRLTSHEQQDEELEKGDTATWIGPRDDECDEKGTQDAKHGANSRADQPFKTDLLKSYLEENNNNSEYDADDASRRRSESEWLKKPSRGCQDENKESPDQQQIVHDELSIRTIKDGDARPRAEYPVVP